MMSELHLAKKHAIMKPGYPRKMKCPICNSRAFDISNFPSEEIKVKLKCPRCNRLVTVPCTEASELVL